MTDPPFPAPSVDRPDREVRLFVALALPPDVRDALHAAAAPLRAVAGRSVAWAAPERLHLTLRFLGERPAELVPPLTEALRDAAAASSPLLLATAEPGAFPYWQRPRVLWIGLEVNDALAALYHSVDSACAALGLGREPRAFRPHLTLGRVRPGTRPDPRALREAAVGAERRLRFPVTTLDLMASELSPSGARHVRLAALPLDGPVPERP